MVSKRNKYTWKKHREVKIEDLPVLSGNAKHNHIRKVRTWTKRKERKHLK